MVNLLVKRLVLWLYLCFQSASSTVNHTIAVSKDTIFLLCPSTVYPYLHEYHVQFIDRHSCVSATAQTFFLFFHNQEFSLQLECTDSYLCHHKRFTQPY